MKLDPIYVLGPPDRSESRRADRRKLLMVAGASLLTGVALCYGVLRSTLLDDEIDDVADDAGAPHSDRREWALELVRRGDIGALVEHHRELLSIVAADASPMQAAQRGGGELWLGVEHLARHVLASPDLDDRVRIARRITATIRGFAPPERAALHAFVPRLMAIR